VWCCCSWTILTSKRRRFVVNSTVAWARLTRWLRSVGCLLTDLYSRLRRRFNHITLLVTHRSCIRSTSRRRLRCQHSAFASGRFPSGDAAWLNFLQFSCSAWIATFVKFGHVNRLLYLLRLLTDLPEARRGPKSDMSLKTRPRPAWQMHSYV